MKLATEQSIRLKEIEQLLVERLLPSNAQRQFQMGQIGAETLQPIALELQALAAQYNSERVGNSRAPLLTSSHAAAYALYYLPLNAAKLLKLFSLTGHPSPRTILDFGSGPGTGALAALNHWGEIDRIDCVEPSEAMRRVGEQLFSSPNLTGKRISFHECLSADTLSGYDLIVCANVLNELNEQNPHEVRALTKRLNPSGRLVILEPGTPHATRSLMRLRDSLLVDTSLVVHFPCTHSAPCPMLQRPTDWCHFELHWDRPRLIQQLDAATGFNKHRIKFSALILGDRNERPEPLNTYRVVSPPTKRPYGRDLEVCGDRYFGTVQCHKRDRRSELRSALWDVDWGDSVTTVSEEGDENDIARAPLRARCIE
jgi:ribosomal protein RSM22 (predicted rRNA methylase)